MAINMLGRCTPGIKGDGGKAAYAACCQMCRYGLDPEDVYDLFMEYFSPRCTMVDGSPYPWEPADALRKVQEGYKQVVEQDHAFGSDLLLEAKVKVSCGKADFIFFDRSAAPDVQLPPGAKSFQAKPNENPQPMPKCSADYDEEFPGPEDASSPTPTPTPGPAPSPAPAPVPGAASGYDRNWIKSQLVRTKEGHPKSAGGNLVTIMSLDTEFLYQFKVNDMNQELYWKDQPLEAYHISQIQQLLLYQYGVSFQVHDIEYEARSQGEKHRFNPARDYFRSLKWDGTCRFKELATEVLHIEATDLNLAYLTKFMTAVVKRTEEPGCKFDSMLVLVGPQVAFPQIENQLKG